MYALLRHCVLSLALESVYTAWTAGPYSGGASASPYCTRGRRSFLALRCPLPCTSCEQVVQWACAKVLANPLA